MGSSEIAKKCTKCHTTKVLDAFHRLRAGEEARQGWCKACTNAHHAAYVTKRRKDDPAFRDANNAKRRAGKEKTKTPRVESRKIVDLQSGVASCSMCKERKPLAAFGMISVTTLDSRCRACHSLQSSAARTRRIAREQGKETP